MLKVIRKILRRPEPKEVDEFPAWMNVAIPGFLTPGNRPAFEYAIKHMGDGAVIEIGSFCGLSTNFIAYYLRKHGRTNKFFAVDPWTFEGAKDSVIGQFSGITHADYRLFIRESFMRNVSFFAPNKPFAIEQPSGFFLSEWSRAGEATDVFGRAVKLGGPIAFAYIDGNHTYAGARQDFKGCDWSLRPGGFILFDDSDSHEDVGKVVRKVLDSGTYDLVMRTPNHLLRKR